MSSPFFARAAHSSNVVQAVPLSESLMMNGANVVGSSDFAEIAARAVSTVASYASGP